MQGNGVRAFFFFLFPFFFFPTPDNCEGTYHGTRQCPSLEIGTAVIFSRFDLTAHRSLCVIWVLSLIRVFQHLHSVSSVVDGDNCSRKKCSSIFLFSSRYSRTLAATSRRASSTLVAESSLSLPSFSFIFYCPLFPTRPGPIGGFSWHLNAPKFASNVGGGAANGRAWRAWRAWMVWRAWMAGRAGRAGRAGHGWPGRHESPPRPTGDGLLID